LGTIHRDATTKIAMIPNGIPVKIGMNGRRLIEFLADEHVGQRRSRKYQQQAQ
jgi:hypothetical protein